MPKIKYKNMRFSAEKLEVIRKANSVIESYQAQGYDLTLRQLYYQFVSRDWLANKLSEYNKLGVIINDARLCGLIDWLAIVDRTRNLRSLASWETPADIVETCAKQFHIDMWEGQENRVEVWIEKDALVGVIAGVCEENDVPYFSCRGYTSSSEMWVASQRLIRYNKQGVRPVILHFGDHDASGIDMTRDITDRLELFGVDLEINRVALNMDQIDQYNPPPNPAKITDTRAMAYIQQYGEESWELDALEPTVLTGLIKTEIDKLRDQATWDERQALKDEGRRYLKAISDRWEDIEEFLEA